MQEKITLANGARIIFEKIPHVRSASCGIWVKSGMRHESREQNGISHFIEHMVFKGTEEKSAAALAAAMDGIGGQVNAFTTKEHTSFYLKTLDTHLKEGLEILCDMFFDSKFAQDDVEVERGVIFEEIGMYEDSPEDLATEKMIESAFARSMLGMPILGTKETLSKMTGETMKDYLRSHYSPKGTVVSISGSFEDGDIEYIKERFSKMRDIPQCACDKAEYKSAGSIKRKDTEQNHICLGFPGMSYMDDKRYAFAMMNNILGGGASSRLFQKVREENGLCYSVYSFNSQYSDAGVHGIYLALSPETEERAVRLTGEEVRRFASEGPTEKEVDRTREQVKANVLMALESTMSRMNSIARSEMAYERVISTDEIIQRYDAVNAGDIRDVAQKVLSEGGMTVSAVGKVKDEGAYRSAFSGKKT